MKLLETFSNLKIRSKLNVGFAVIIIMLAIISIISYFSLLNINNRIILYEDAIDIELEILRSTTLINDFKASYNHDLEDQVKNKISYLKNHSIELRENIKNDEYQKHLDTIISELDVYRAAFNNYVSAHDDEYNHMTTMRETARVVLELTDDLVNNQKSKFKKQIRNRSNNLESSYLLLDKLYELSYLSLELRRNEKDYIISNGEDKYFQLYNNNLKKIEGLCKSLNEEYSNQSDIKLINNIISSVNAYKKSFDEYRQTLEHQNKVEANLNEAAAHVDRGGRQAQTDQISEMDETVFYTKLLIIIISITSILLGIYFSNFISNLISKPIVKLKGFAEIISKGDLTVEVQSEQKDEIGDLANSFITMQNRLRNQLQEITEGVNVLSSSSSEIMAMISQLASTSAETATSVSETSTTVEEVKQTAEISNQKASEVSESSQKISMISQEGNKSVRETIDGMNKIKQQMELIAEIVIQLSDKSQAIGDIASTVSELAEQSNLLAVNASIEAAKAGEHGKGFSVVAQKIDILAERSKDATSQIRSILTDIQKDISSAVMATEQGGKVIDEGLILSNTANEVITTLASGIEEASQSSLQIAASSQQQLVGMDQITSAIDNIKEASLQASASTKQTEESISELNGLGNKLMEILKLYKL